MVSLLLEHDLEYLSLELERGTVWQANHSYTEELLKKRLRDTPCVFSFISGPNFRSIVAEIRVQEMAEFEYEFIGERSIYDWHPESYTEEQLGPQW